MIISILNVWSCKFSAKKNMIYSLPILPKYIDEVVQFRLFRTKPTIVIYSDDVFVPVNLLFCSCTLSDYFDNLLLVL